MNLPVLLITGLALLGILVFQLFQWQRKKRKSIIHGPLARFKDEVTLLNSSVEVFSELSEEYFNSIHSNGFVELCKIKDALNAVIECCVKLDEAKDIARRDKLLNYVYVQRGKGPSPGYLFQTMNEDLILNLANWEERLTEILLKLTEGIRASSSSFKNMGRNRTSKRHNTTHLLNELVGMVRR